MCRSNKGEIKYWENAYPFFFITITTSGHLTETTFIFTLSVPAHIYEEVVPKAALSSVQSAGNATPDAVAPYESVQDTAAVDSANQNERVYHTIGQTVKDSVRPEERHYILLQVLPVN